MIISAIIATYLLGLALFFAGLTPVWPWLLGCCVIAGIKNPRAGIILFIAVTLLQFIKANIIPDHLWVYYAGVYAILGFTSTALVDRIAGATSLIIAGVFLFGPADLTEVVFMLGLIGAVYIGPTGGIYSGLPGIARQSAQSGVSFGGRSYRGPLAGSNGLANHTAKNQSVPAQDR